MKADLKYPLSSNYTNIYRLKKEYKKDDIKIFAYFFFLNKTYCMIEEKG